MRINIMLNYHHRETIRMFNGFFLIEITEVIYFCFKPSHREQTHSAHQSSHLEVSGQIPYSPEKVSSFVGRMT